MTQSFDIGAFYGHEHQDKARAFHAGQRGIVLGRKLVNMRAHRPQMRVQKSLSRRFFSGIHSLFVGHQRHLAIEHNLLAIGQKDDEIRVVGAAILAAKQHLRIKMRALVQAGRFQRAFQLHFAPVAQGFLIALERTRQCLRIMGHFHAHVHQLADL